MPLADPIALYPDETIEDLQRAGLRLIQPRDGFRFGEDSVLLAARVSELCNRSQHLRLADLGAGCGAVSVLLAGRLPAARLTAVELCNRSYDALRRNISLNQLDSRLVAVQGDIRRIADGSLHAHELPDHGFDLVVSNPPFRLPGRHLANPQANCLPGRWEKRIAVEEITLSLDNLVEAAARLLKPRGHLCLVHRPGRLPDLMHALRRWRIEPRLLQAVQPRAATMPTSIFLTGQYLGRPGQFQWLPPLIVRQDGGDYHPDMARLYGIAEVLEPAALLHGIIQLPRPAAVGLDLPRPGP